MTTINNIDTEVEETPEVIRAAAFALVAEADALATDLERRAQDGDESVTLDDLDAAERQSRWARIRAAAAEKKAAKRAEVLQQQAYAHLIDRDLDEAVGDPTDDIRAAVREALPHVRRALDLLTEHNRAVLRMAKYAADPDQYKPAEDGLSGFFRADLPIDSNFTYRGDTHRPVEVDVLLRALIRPVRREVEAGSLGAAPEWLREV